MSATYHEGGNVRRGGRLVRNYLDEDIDFGLEGLAGDSVEDIDELIPINEVFVIAHSADYFLAL